MVYCLSPGQCPTESCQQCGDLALWHPLAAGPGDPNQFAARASSRRHTRDRARSVNFGQEEDFLSVSVKISMISILHFQFKPEHSKSNNTLKSHCSKVERESTCLKNQSLIYDLHYTLSLASALFLNVKADRYIYFASHHTCSLHIT